MSDHGASTLIRTHQRGMSLLEILVVLAILGLTLVVAAPPMFRVLESVSFKMETDDIKRQISDLRIIALLEKRTVTLDARLIDEVESNSTEGGSGDDDRTNAGTSAGAPGGISLPAASPFRIDKDLRLVTLPEGWSLEGDNLVFLKTGICLGGTVMLHSPSGRARTLNFKAPDCELIAGETR